MFIGKNLHEPDETIVRETNNEMMKSWRKKIKTSKHINTKQSK